MVRVGRGGEERMGGRVGELAGVWVCRLGGVCAWCREVVGQGRGSTRRAAAAAASWWKGRKLSI